MDHPVPVFISIGANLGDKYENCLKGIACMQALPCTSVVAVSPFYQTDPVDFTDQDWFVNGMVKIETALSPRDLMDSLQGIERSLGQYEKSVRFGPRLIDLDIVFYGDRVMTDTAVTLPHPRMHKRRFVLQPLCDIGADTVHPVLNRTVQALLSDLADEPDQRVIFYRNGPELPL